MLAGQGAGVVTKKRAGSRESFVPDGKVVRRAAPYSTSASPTRTTLPSSVDATRVLVARR